MNQKLPYYMAYPMPLAYDDERTERMDFEYMKSLYPDIPKRILPYVEEECDRMEYENSMVFDEYPDKLQLRLMCGRIYENVRRNEKMLYGTPYAEILKKTDRGATEETTKGTTKETAGAAGNGEASRSADADMPEENKVPAGHTFEEIAKGVSGNVCRAQGGCSGRCGAGAGRAAGSCDAECRGGCRIGGRMSSDGLRDLIEVMLYQELYKRRCDNRRRKRRFY